MTYKPSTTTGYAFLMPGGYLAQGSAPPSGEDIPFDVIVLAAQEYQRSYQAPPGRKVMYVPLDDGPKPDAIERARIHAAAREIAEYVRAGRRVLVTCWQGRNRSGVLAGLALVELGLPPHRAIRRIRSYRNGLTNNYFRDMVGGLL
jgi:protein-tyrosine phosphatase